MTRYLDSHIHLSDPQYAPDMDSVLQGMKSLGMRACCVSVNHQNSLETLELAKRSSLVLPFTGIHPEHAADDLEGIISMIRENRDMIAGIGEIGLDPTYGDAQRQAHVFEALLSCAQELGKPVSVHSRKSLDDILDIMTSYDAERSLLHWFDGSKRQLARAMDMGFFVSFGPVMIYANDKQALLSRCDESKILVETDGPVRFSRCFEGKPADIGFIPSVIFAASKILKRSFDDTASLLEQNADSYLGRYKNTPDLDGSWIE